MFISERHRRRRGPLVVAAVLLALAGAALAAFLILSNRTDDVRRGDEVEFRAPPPPPPKDDTVDWPVYHYDTSHTGYLRANVAPPFKERWVFSGKVLMEFPPIVVDGSVYFMRNNGGTYRLDADTGKVKWKNQIGKLSATSPAYSDGRLFVSSLSGQDRRRCEPATARSCGRSSSASRTESSPIVRRGIVYFGTEGGDLYALFAKTGRVKWKFNASGAIKASPALSGSTLYVGDYSGRMYAVWAKTGRERWSTGTSGSQFGFAAGNFYSTPAVDFGRVYAGNTDGKVYSFGARTGDARLVPLDRRLRLLLPRRRKRAGHEADGLRRLLRRQHVRTRRAHRVHALDRAGRRPHLGRAFGGRPHRLLRRPRLEEDLRRRRAQRKPACSSAAAATTTRSCPTASGST